MGAGPLPGGIIANLEVIGHHQNNVIPGGIPQALGEVQQNVMREQEYVMFEWKGQRMSTQVEKPINESVVRRKLCDLFNIHGNEIASINVFNMLFMCYEVVNWNALPATKRFEGVPRPVDVPAGEGAEVRVVEENVEEEENAAELQDVDPLDTPPLPDNFALPNWSQDVAEALERKDPPVPALKLLINKDIYDHIRKTYKQWDLARGDYKVVADLLVNTYPHLKDGVIVLGQHGRTYRKSGTWVTSLRRTFRLKRSRVNARERAQAQEKYKRKTAQNYIDPLAVPLRSLPTDDQELDAGEDELTIADLKDRMGVLWSLEPPALEELQGLMKRTCVDRRKLFRNLKKPEEIHEEYPFIKDLKLLVADGVNHFKRNLGDVRKAYMSHARTNRVWPKLMMSRSKFVKDVVQWVNLLPLHEQDKAKSEAALLVLPALTNDTRKMFVLFDVQEPEIDFPILKIEKQLGSPFQHCQSMSIIVHKQKLSWSTVGLCDLGEAFDALATVLKLYAIDPLHPRVSNSMRFLLEFVYGFPRSKPLTQGMQTILTYFA